MMSTLLFRRLQSSGDLLKTGNKTVKEKLEVGVLKNNRNSIIIRAFSSFIKLATCLLYIAQLIIRDVRRNYDETHPGATSISQKSDILIDNSNNATVTTSNGPGVIQDIIWINLVFTQYEPIIRYMQFGLAVYGMVELLVYSYISFDGRFMVYVNPYLLIEFSCCILWIFEVSIPQAKNLYVPVFLNCWVVKRNLDVLFKDLNNMNSKYCNKIIQQHLINLIIFLLCMVLTSCCGFEWLQRAAPDKTYQRTLMDSFYYTIITLSTVGYGDISPTWWLSKLFIVAVIVVAIIVIPVKIEILVSLYLEAKKTGGKYKSRNKHIVLCLSELEHDFILYFLNEFYGHRSNQTTHTILLSTSEMNQQVKLLLNSTLWMGKVFYIFGSALRDTDLERAKIQTAKGIFIVSPNGFMNKALADEYTILRSWTIKDFAPTVPQYVQLYRNENKVNLEYVEHLICEDEFKYGTLANNCICPGISTLITLLMYKGGSKENSDGLEPWQKLYGELAGNEIHSTCISKSRFFNEFLGRKFPIAAYIAHKKYGACLLGVATTDDRYRRTSLVLSDDGLPYVTPAPLDTFSLQRHSILLNPGFEYEFGEDDICIYTSLTKEENYKWKNAKAITNQIDLHPDSFNDEILKGPNLYIRSGQQKTFELGLDEIKSMDDENETSEGSESTIDEENEKEIIEKDDGKSIYHETVSLNSQSPETSSKPPKKEKVDLNDSYLMVDKPPTDFFGFFTTKCKLLREPNPLCCLELHGLCKHSSNKALIQNWPNKNIIVAAESASNGLLNFIAPLRGKDRTTAKFKPIILLLKNKPNEEFLESICSFPLVYWQQGAVTSIDSLLQAGILNCSALVLVSGEQTDCMGHDSLFDSSNIFAIENVFKFFPYVKIFTELRRASNISFMKFRVKNVPTNIKYKKTSYMFQVPFASGSVFSSAMLDTLLYQAYGRQYLIELVKLLIGLKQIEGSGTLTAIPLHYNDMWLKTYGNLFRKLAFTTGEIPIGIYRTELREIQKDQVKSNKECQRLVIEKMKKQKIDLSKYDTRDVLYGNSIAYVVVNPPHDFQLHSDDIIYVLKPAKIGYSSFDRPVLHMEIEEKKKKLRF